MEMIADVAPVEVEGMIAMCDGGTALARTTNDGRSCFAGTHTLMDVLAKILFASRKAFGEWHCRLVLIGHLFMNTMMDALAICFFNPYVRRHFHFSLFFPRLSGHAQLGHPMEYIQLNRKKMNTPETCKYCGFAITESPPRIGIIAQWRFHLLALFLALLVENTFINICSRFGLLSFPAPCCAAAVVAIRWMILHRQTPICGMDRIHSSAQPCTFFAHHLVVSTGANTDSLFCLFSSFATPFYFCRSFAFQMKKGFFPAEH